MMPVIAWNALHASTILREAMKVLRDAVRRRHRRRRGARARAARSQHRGRDRAQPVHRLRGDRRDREGVGEDRPIDPRARARARPARRDAARRDPVGRGDDARRNRRASRDGRRIGGQVRRRKADEVGEGGVSASRRSRSLLVCPAAAPPPPAAPPSASAASAAAAPQQNRLFPPQDLGLLEAPDREQWQKPDQIMDALGIADGVDRRRPRRRRRLVHDAARAPRRPERPRLRRGHPAADDRGDQPARAAREPDERQHGARHADRSAAAARPRRRADRRRLSRDGRAGETVVPDP